MDDVQKRDASIILLGYGERICESVRCSIGEVCSNKDPAEAWNCRNLLARGADRKHRDRAVTQHFLGGRTHEPAFYTAAAVRSHNEKFRPFFLDRLLDFFVN